LEYFRKTGPGWQSRINEALRKAAGLQRARRPTKRKGAANERRISALAMRQSHSGIDSRQAIKAAFFPLLRPKYSLFRAKNTPVPRKTGRLAATIWNS
jgi:hypothetical protein